MADSEQRLDSDELQRLAVEVNLGVPAERSNLPDTPAVRAARAELAEQIGSMKAAGQTVDVGHEWPDPAPLAPVD